MKKFARVLATDTYFFWYVAMVGVILLIPYVEFNANGFWEYTLLFVGLILTGGGTYLYGYRSAMNAHKKSSGPFLRPRNTRPSKTDVAP